MKLEQIEKGSNYKEGWQGKRVRYNAPTEEMSMNTSNNKQVPTVRVPLNYSQVLQTPAPTDIQMDIDREGNGMVQFPSLPKPQLPGSMLGNCWIEVTLQAVTKYIAHSHCAKSIAGT